jgi:superfamily II DNA or RNA helicase
MSVTPKGYRVSLDSDKLKILEKELKVKPFNLEGASKEYKLFRKSAKFMYCPKFYMIKKYGIPTEISYHDTPTVKIDIFRSPRDYQATVAGKVLDHIQKNYSAVCSLHTGWGKTWLALWLAHNLSVKTLVVVHTRALLDQWVTKIKDFTGIDAGIIQQSNVKIDSPICVGMIHSLCLRDYPKEVNEGFGFVLFDEVHHTPSELFSGVFFKIYIKYSLGLSATLNRSDGLSKVINWFLGDTVVDIKQNSDPPCVEYHKFFPETPFDEQMTIMGKPNLPAMITDLCMSPERNEFILNIVKKLYQEGRITLILTHRIAHAHYLFNNLQDYSVGLYIGGMSQEALNESNARNIIIGTYHMASEGYDNTRLNTLVLATPKSDIEQSVGRIGREKGINKALVIDIQDFHSLFGAMNYKRIKFYKKKKIYQMSEEPEQLFLNLDFKES